MCIGETCLDTEDAQDPYVTGAAWNNANKRTADGCIVTDHRILDQPYCSDDGDVKNKRITCENTCKDGACIQ